MSRMVDRDVLMGFISEAKGYLPDITGGLAGFQKNPAEFDLLEEPYRYAHTIKGASSMVGLASLSHIAFQLEETFEKLSSGQLSLDDETATLLHEVVAVMDVYLDEAMLGEVNDKPLLAAVTHLFRRVYRLPVEGDGAAVKEVFEQFGFAAHDYGLSVESPAPPLSHDDFSRPAQETESELLPPPDFAGDEEPQAFPELHTEMPAFDLPESFEPPEPSNPPAEPQGISPASLVDASEVQESAPERQANAALEVEAQEAQAPDIPAFDEERDRAPLFTRELRTKETASLAEPHEDFYAAVESSDEAAKTDNEAPVVERQTQDLVTPVTRIADIETDDSAPVTECLAPDVSEMPIASEIPAENNLIEQATSEVDETAEPVADLEEPLASEAWAAEATEVEECQEQVGAAAVEVEAPEELEDSLSGGTELTSVEVCGVATASPPAATDDFSGVVSTEETAVLLPALEPEADELSSTDVALRNGHSEAPAVDLLYAESADGLPTLDAGEPPPACETAEQASKELDSPFEFFNDQPELSKPAEQPEDVRREYPLESGAGDELAAKPQVAGDLRQDSAPPDLYDDLREVFMLEAEDHLKTISLSLAGLTEQPGDRDLLQEVRRSAHSLKGSAGMVGFTSIAQLAHRMEDLLDLLYEGDYTITSDIINLLFASADVLEDLTEGDANAGKLAAIYEEFDKILGAEGESRGRLPEDALPEVGFDELVAYGYTTIESFDAGAEGEAGAQESFIDEPVVDIGTGERQERLVEAISLLQESIAASTTTMSITTTGEATAEAVAEATVEAATEAATEETEGDMVAAAAPSAVGDNLAKPAARKPSQTLRVPLGRLDEMVKIVSELVIARTAFEQRMADFERLAEELQGSSERLRRVASKLETQYEASTLGGSQSFLLTTPASPALAAFGNPIASLATFNTHGFDDLDFDRYTEFHLLSREVSETSNDIQTLAHEYRQLLGDFDGYLNRQGRLYGEVQDRLMRARMVPLATLTARLQRAVRNVADSQGKRVRLVLEGEATELDKAVLEEMADPLQHILRNAVDHGVEPPELRQVKGKPPEATVRVRASYEGTQVVIRISDDGTGINLGLVRAAAIRKGYAALEDAERMADEDLLALIFAPGFSTAEGVSEISGRGIGMDVVKTTVHRLKGSVAVDSAAGVGTTFTIRLPMVLAITRALMVRANNEVFAVPLPFISQIVRVVRGELEQLGQGSQEPVLTFGGEDYAVYSLADALGLKGQPDDAVRRPPVLLMDLDGRRVAAYVDELLGGHEIVVKNLGNHLRAVRGVSGATVMGDGSVVLILNPTDLFGESARAGVRPVAPPPTAKTIGKTITVLIVDDSPSVRRVVSNVIRGANWDALQAKDGLDALDLLHQAKTLPDVVLLDIEMPRMDGYELLKNLRAQPEYKDLPVVMLTSRAGDRHREKAFAYGATEYLVKPYQDETLLALVRELAAQRREEGGEERRQEGKG